MGQPLTAPAPGPPPWALTSPGGIPRHRRSTAGVLCPWHTWGEFRALRKVGGPGEPPNPAFCTHLGQVSQHQHVPLGVPLDHPFPLSGHIVILVPQGVQRPWLGSEDREVCEPRAGPGPSHPHASPTDCGKRRPPCCSRSVDRRKSGPCTAMAKRFLPTTSQRKGDWNCPSPVGIRRRN